MNIIKRIKSPTPFYWKRISQIGTAVATVGTTLMTVQLNPVLTNVASYLVAIGVVVATVARTAKMQE